MKQKKEEEANPNALFKVQQISRPMISEKAPLKGVALRDTYLYDVDTRRISDNYYSKIRHSI